MQKTIFWYPVNGIIDIVALIIKVWNFWLPNTFIIGNAKIPMGNTRAFCHNFLVLKVACKSS